MTLTEIGIMTGKDLKIRRSGRVQIVSFENTEVKEGCCLVSYSGRNANLLKAKRDYCHYLSGEIIVVDAMKDTRREYQLPPKITSG